MVFNVQNFSGISVNISGFPVVQMDYNVNTGFLTGLFYPLYSNPQGYVTSTAGGTALQVTGSFPFLTGINLTGISGTIVTLSGGYLLISSNVGGGNTNVQVTGSSTLANANFTGISGISVILSGNYVLLNTTSLQNQLTNLINGTGNFISSFQTGNFITNSQTGNFITSNQTGSFITASQTGLLINAFYPLSSNPDNYITSSQTGVFVTTGQTGNFGGITNTGQLTGAFYPLNSNPSGYVVGSVVSVLNSKIGNITLGGQGNISVSTNGQTINISGDTGIYSTFVTTGQTGSFGGGGSFNTGTLVGTFALLNSVNNFTRELNIFPGISIGGSSVLNCNNFAPNSSSTLTFNSSNNNFSGNINITGNAQINFSDGANIQDGMIYDSSNNTSVDWSNRRLWNSSQITVDWENSYLINSITSNITVNWLAQNLNDSNGTLSVDWGNRVLYNKNSNNNSLDWLNYYLIDSNNLNSIDWTNRILSGNWNAQNLTISGKSITTGGPYAGLSTKNTFNNTNIFTGNGILLGRNAYINSGRLGTVITEGDVSNPFNIDWITCVLNDTGNNNLSLDWTNRLLYDSNQNISIDYNNRILSGNWLSANLINTNQTGIFITNNQTGQFVTTGQTGSFGGGGSFNTGTLVGTFALLNSVNNFTRELNIFPGISIGGSSVLNCNNFAPNSSSTLTFNSSNNNSLASSNLFTPIIINPTGITNTGNSYLNIFTGNYTSSGGNANYTNVLIAPNYNFNGPQSGTLYDLRVNSTSPNVSGANHYFFDVSNSGSSLFNIDASGYGNFSSGLNVTGYKVITTADTGNFISTSTTVFNQSGVFFNQVTVQNLSSSKIINSGTFINSGSGNFISGLFVSGIPVVTDSDYRAGSGAIVSISTPVLFSSALSYSGYSVCLNFSENPSSPFGVSQWWATNKSLTGFFIGSNYNDPSGDPLLFDYTVWLYN